jgi:hypothetical protein
MKKEAIVGYITEFCSGQPACRPGIQLRVPLIAEQVLQQLAGAADRLVAYSWEKSLQALFCKTILVKMLHVNSRISGPNATQLQKVSSKYLLPVARSNLRPQNKWRVNL